ncbi:MAG: hypothetical protein H0V36_02315 [Chloroflexi bacterium]|nr:hypothetical protein [Chloroflexota bacterium]
MAVRLEQSDPRTAPVEPAASSDRKPRGVHLVGSIPLTDAHDVFRAAADSLGDRVRRIPDGETGPRSDWIVWQYPVLSSRPQFEVTPPDPDHYRPLPRLRLRDGESADTVRFEGLGYAQAAIASFGEFARLKVAGLIPRGVRFQVSLPTPLAPISAFVAAENQASMEPVYQARMLQELAEIVDAIAHDQLAIQWDTNFELGMLEGVFPVWFSDVRGGILERLLRLGRHVPPDVELGYHLCYGDTQHRHYKEPEDARNLVEVANALAGSLDRPLNWIHMPVPRGRDDQAYYEPLRDLRLRPETELYLGLVHATDGLEGTQRRIRAAQMCLDEFGVATECGWGRRAPQTIPGLLEIHRMASAPHAGSGIGSVDFEWPDGLRDPVDTFGLAYDRVERHGWYKNLDLTVEELAQTLKEGDVLIDYSGGTGILLDRVRLRIFDRPIGMIIADSSAKFLRVAVEKFRDDPRLAFRLMRWMKDQKRLQYLDEVLPELAGGGIDVIASTNAIHLYMDLAETLDSWVRMLGAGGKVFINSGNIRNPRARPSEWILDETVWVIHEVAEGLVRTDPRYAAYRDVLDDHERMVKHGTHRDRVFLAPRPLQHYLDSLEEAGLHVTSVKEATIEASVDDWFELMSAYHEAVLGWIGGTQKVDGQEAPEVAVKDRIQLIRESMEVLFAGRNRFTACWTYITAER